MDILKSFFNRVSTLRKSTFAASALTLMTGTIIAQSIPILISPFLTRLYTPADFGVLALFMAFVTTIATIATGRYELSIMLNEDEGAINVCVFSFCIVISVSVTALLLIIFFKDIIIRLLQNASFLPWLYAIPVAVFFVSSYEILLYWFINKRAFKRLAATKVFESSTTSAAQVGFGLSKFNGCGLIPGYIMGQMAGAGLLGWRAWREDRNKLRMVSSAKMLEQAFRNKDFPLYALPSSFVNIMASQIPNFLFAIFFGSVTVGLFYLPQKILGTPLAVMGRSILDVFKERASRDFRTQGNCLDIFQKTFRSLLLIAVVPFAIFFIFSPRLVPLIFGPQWKIAGEYAQVLSVMFFLRFIASPLSYVFYVAQKQRYDLIWQLTLLVLTVVAIFLGVSTHNPKVSIVYFSAFYSVMYIILLLLSYNFAKGGKKGDIRNE